MKDDDATRRAFLKSLCGIATGGVGAALTGCEDPGDPSHADPAKAADAAALSDLLDAQPALFRPTDRGCTVQWVARRTIPTRVLAGDHPGALAIAKEQTARGPTAVTLDQLPPNRQGWLQCQFRASDDRWIAGPLQQFRTARPAGSQFRVALIADSHCYSRLSRTPGSLDNMRKTVRRVLGDRPDFVIFLGDEGGVWSKHDAPGSMNANMASRRWSLWRETFQDLLAQVPAFVALGNHEGEAGYYQSVTAGEQAYHYQRWGTRARKQYCLNPTANTYPEGGENQGWRDPDDPDAVGDAALGNASPLQNYYAWTWGDALFCVLDPFRYTNPGGRPPRSAEEWTLGVPQREWFEQVLRESRARWKFVVCHHVVGGWPYGPGGERSRGEVYGRGGAAYAQVGEQAELTRLMQAHGAHFFMYGHDHIFAHQRFENLNFVCCGRPTWLQSKWWRSTGWREAYGSAKPRDPHDFIAAIGYVRLTVSDTRVRCEYVRAGTDPDNLETVDQPEGASVYDATWPA